MEIPRMTMGGDGVEYEIVEGYLSEQCPLHTKLKRITAIRGTCFEYSSVAITCDKYEQGDYRGNSFSGNLSFDPTTGTLTSSLNVNAGGSQSFLIINDPHEPSLF